MKASKEISDRGAFWNWCAREWRYLGEHSRENMVYRVRALLADTSKVG